MISMLRRVVVFTLLCTFLGAPWAAHAQEATPAPAPQPSTSSPILPLLQYIPALDVASALTNPVDLIYVNLASVTEQPLLAMAMSMLLGAKSGMKSEDGDAMPSLATELPLDKFDHLLINGDNDMPMMVLQGSFTTAEAEQLLTESGFSEFDTESGIWTRPPALESTPVIFNQALNIDPSAVIPEDGVLLLANGPFVLADALGAEESGSLSANENVVELLTSVGDHYDAMVLLSPVGATMVANMLRDKLADLALLELLPTASNVAIGVPVGDLRLSLHAIYGTPEAAQAAAVAVDIAGAVSGAGSLIDVEQVALAEGSSILQVEFSVNLPALLIQLLFGNLLGGGWSPYPDGT